MPGNALISPKHRNSFLLSSLALFVQTPKPLKHQTPRVTTSVGHCCVSSVHLGLWPVCSNNILQVNKCMKGCWHPEWSNCLYVSPTADLWRGSVRHLVTGGNWSCERRRVIKHHLFPVLWTVFFHLSKWGSPWGTRQGLGGGWGRHRYTV